MKILAFDTATAVCTIALSNGDKIVQSHQQASQSHGQIILPEIRRLCAESKLGLQALDLIAFGQGPGSFTGLRIAASVAQALASRLNLPVVGLSSLQSLAQGAWRAHRAEHVLSVIDARMSQVYYGCYQLQDGIMQATSPDGIADPSHGALPAMEEVWYGVGNGFAAYPVLQSGWATEPEAIDYGAEIQAKDMIALAQHAAAVGKLTEPAKALPVYIRNNVTHQRGQHG